MIRVRGLERKWRGIGYIRNYGVVVGGRCGREESDEEDNRGKK